MTETIRRAAARMLFGDTLSVKDAEQAQVFLGAYLTINQIQNAVEYAKQITQEALRYADDCRLRAVGLSHVIGMPTVHFVFDTLDEPFDIANAGGCYCYVCNLQAPECS